MMIASLGMPLPAVLCNASAYYIGGLSNVRHSGWKVALKPQLSEKSLKLTEQCGGRAHYVIVSKI